MAGLPQDDTSLEKLQHISRLMALLAMAGMIIVPLEVLTSYLLPGKLPFHDFQFCLSENCGGDLVRYPFDRRLIAAAVMMIPAGFAVWMFASLTRLFFRYARGEIFSTPAIGYLRSAAVGLIACVVLRLALKVPVMAFLSWQNLAGGHRSFGIFFEIHDIDLILLFIAGTLLSLTQVIAVAKTLAEKKRGPL